MREDDNGAPLAALLIAMFALIAICAVLELING